MPKKEPTHLTYLIRLWQVHSEGKTVWRVSLEDAHSGLKRCFGDPFHLFAFLREKLGLNADLPNDNHPSTSSQVEKPK